MMNKLTRVHLRFPAFMPCTTMVAYRVLQVFHYHSIYFPGRYSYNKRSLIHYAAAILVKSA